jgi:hypothetical protein
VVRKIRPVLLLPPTTTPVVADVKKNPKRYFNVRVF